MSFVRVPRRSQSLSGRNKKTKKKKPTWDSTTSDLTVHKLSKDELDRRHVVHQSTNLDVIKEEKRRKAVLKANKERSLSEGNQAGLLREILYDEKQLNDALAHSDRVMSVVKDLFYDDPKRLKAIPHITRAPGGDSDRRRAGPISEKGPHTSYLDVWSESVMDPSALNEYQEEDSDEEETDEDDEDDDDEETPVFDSKLDVDRFQSYIQRAAAEKPLEREERRQLKHQFNKENMDPAGTPDRPPLTTSQQKAINDTAKAKKKLRSRSKAKGQSSLLDVTQKTKPEDLRMYLNELMSACSAFDRTRGEEEAEDVSHSFSSGFPQLSGYTAFLVQTLTKILKHLNESETQLAQEREARRRVEQETTQQRKLIDAMTVDMMQSQELNMQIQAEARRQINQMEQRLQIVEHLMVNQDFLDVPPPSGNEKKDALERSPPVSEAQVSNPLPSASTTGTGTDNSRTSSQSNSVQQAIPKSTAGQISSQTLDSVPAISTEPTLPGNRTGHVTVTGKTGTKLSVSQVQSTAVPAISRNVLGATEVMSHKVSSSSHQVPQLSQHTVDRLMSSRHIQGSGNVHLTGNLANIQTNVPSGLQSHGSLPAGNVQRSVDGMGGTSGFGMMSSNERKGRDPILQGNAVKNPTSVAFSSSRQQKPDASMNSSTQHLNPIQPAMLLSPPRQKDRRDFIKPPGHQPQPYTAAQYGQTHGGITGMNSYSSAGIRMSTQQPRAVSFGSTPRFPGDLSHPVRRNDLMSGMNSQTRHPPPQPLFNNYTSNLAGQVEAAPSITSMDSSSTRYLSLPGDHGGTNVIKNLLHQDTSDNAQQFQPSAQPGRMGPNGQDHHQTSRSNHPVGMDTVYESSTDGTVDPRGEDTSVDLNEKIASLSRQRVEAQARLEQLKDVYGGEGSMSAPQRPTTSGGEATDHRPLSAKQTGVLIGDSPPVSPIARDPPSQRPIPTGTSHVAPEGRTSYVAPEGRTLHVSMPKLSELEISATSTPASKRTSIGSGGPSPNINQNDWKTPMKDSPGKEQFFALKAHIST